jgi:hypothetical protein
MRMVRLLAISVSLLAACDGSIGFPLGPSGSGDDGPPAGACPDDDPDCVAASGIAPPERAPLRRLTRFEYDNSVRDLFGDETQPASALPADQLGNGFGNDADALSVSGLLAEQYGIVAEGIAARATESREALARLDGCAADVSDDSAAACTRTIVERLAPRVFRRPLLEGEADELAQLASSVRGLEGNTFANGIAALIQALLQSPDFLYRPELGEPDTEHPSLRRPTGHEMATRLSYLFWGTTPDEQLREAAASGALSTDEGVRRQAERLLDDPRSHVVLRFFFDNLLPINGLTDLTRDPELYPAYSGALGAAMREETQRLIEYEIFEGSGSWAKALTAPYTFANELLADFYGIPGVSGEAFRKVDVPDTSRRLGVLLTAGVMAGTTTTNLSNPVLRGSFVANKLLCRKIKLPTDPEVLDDVEVPDETSGATARERFSKHSSDVRCAGCHALLDPLGFPLENFDAIGQWRDQENGVTIDASGSVPGTPGSVDGPVGLVKKLAETESTHACFAKHWMNFAYGRSLEDDEMRTQRDVQAAFKASEYNVKELLLALAQSEAFLYLPDNGAVPGRRRGHPTVRAEQ